MTLRQLQLIASSVLLLLFWGHASAQETGFKVTTIEGNAGANTVGSCDSDDITLLLSNGYGPDDCNLFNEAKAPKLNPNCIVDHGNTCINLQKPDFVQTKTDTATCESSYLERDFDHIPIMTYSNCRDAMTQLYNSSEADMALWDDANDASYNAACMLDYSKNCTALTRAEFSTTKSAYDACTTTYSVCKSIGNDLDDGGSLSADTITLVATTTSSTVDSDLTLSNPLHLSFVQSCVGSNADVASINACTANVDGTALNKHVVSEIAGGASGSITADLLEDAGVSSSAATFATGNTCGPNEDQSCLSEINSILSAGSNFTSNQIEIALANYINGLVEDDDTQVDAATTSAGCSSSATSFSVPNPPSICASVNWNCSSNTAGISVTYDDNGKGNIVVDTTTFSGGAYTVTASLAVGSQTRTKPINGTVNVNQLSAAAGAGYKTGSQPAWWRNYNVIERAAAACSSQGGSLTTYNELKTANDTYNIIGNGTRTIFADASGNATASTSGRQQCSESWPSGPNSLRWYTWARSQTCKGRAGFGRNFTYVCKDIPCS